MTSCPMRGIWMNPHFFPAHVLDTRTQHELFSSFFPCAVPVELHLHAAVLVDEDLLAARSDDDAPSASVHDRLAASRRGGRYGTLRGIASNVVRSSRTSPLPVV